MCNIPLERAGYDLLAKAAGGKHGQLLSDEGKALEIMVRSKSSDQKFTFLPLQIALWERVEVEANLFCSQAGFVLVSRVPMGNSKYLGVKVKLIADGEKIEAP